MHGCILHVQMAICYFIVSLSIKAKYCTYQVTLDVSLHCGYPKHCWHIASGWEFGEWDGMHHLFMYLPFDIWRAGVKTLWSWENKVERLLCCFQWMFGAYNRHKNRKVSSLCWERAGDLRAGKTSVLISGISRSHLHLSYILILVSNSDACSLSPCFSIDL